MFKTLTQAQQRAIRKNGKTIMVFLESRNRLVTHLGRTYCVGKTTVFETWMPGTARPAHMMPAWGKAIENHRRAA